MAVDPEKAKPKVRHTNITKEMSAFKKAWSEFNGQVMSRFEELALKGRTGWSKPDGEAEKRGEHLLRRRKDLLRITKEGMRDKKDKEVDIAIAAFFVWFDRQDFEKQLMILRGELW